MKQLAFFSLIIPLILLGQGKVELDESFDPTTLSDWGYSKVRIEKMKSLKDYYAGMGNGIDSLDRTEHSDFVFRVQLASTKDYEAAKAVEERALQAFDEEIMIQFDSPYYKIRVGSMNNREDAQKLQSFAIQHGYRRAWVIRTKNQPRTEN